MGLPNQPGPFLLHLGFKWDSSDNAKAAVARYNWYPLLSIDAIQERFSSLLDPHRYGRLPEIANGIVSLASARIPYQDILFLEVTEKENPRISFDINMYRANLRMVELYPLLLKMCRHYSIPSKEFYILYDKVKNKTFGHLSCGIDREGRDFLTVYYSVEGIDGYGVQSSVSDHESALAGGLGWRTPLRKPLLPAWKQRMKRLVCFFGL